MVVRNSRILSLLVLVVSLVCAHQTALAQRDAGAKARGEFGTGFWSNRSASRQMRHARDYAGGLFDYSWRARNINPQYATAEAAEVQRNIQSARKNLQRVRQEESTNKDIVARLDSIDKHLSSALEHHEAFCAECAKDEANAHAMMSCCNDMLTELDKAISEHQALIRGITTNAKTNE